MKYYRVKVLTAYHNGLNESASKVPMDFYVKCKNNETINECFAKISRKFKNQYNIVIKSADIKQVNEGLWDRTKAFFAGDWAATKAGNKNSLHKVGNAARRVANGVKAATSNNPENEKYHKMKHEDVEGERNNARLRSLLKSKVKKLAALSKDIKVDATKMDVEFDDTTNKLIKAIDLFVKKYSK